jgi:hypothetical protein
LISRFSFGLGLGFYVLECVDGVVAIYLMKIVVFLLPVAILLSAIGAATAARSGGGRPIPQLGGRIEPQSGEIFDPRKNRGVAVPECQSDVQKYCRDWVGPNQITCMQANMGNLSDVCRSAISMKRQSSLEESTPNAQIGSLLNE